MRFQRIISAGKLFLVVALFSMPLMDRAILEIPTFFFQTNAQVPAAQNTTQTPDPIPSAAVDFTLDTTKAFPGSIGAKPGDKDYKPYTLDSIAGLAISLMLQLLATVGIVVCIVGAFKMVTAEGDSGQLKKGQQAFMNGAIGTILVLISYLLVIFVRDFILKING